MNPCSSKLKLFLIGLMRLYSMERFNLIVTTFRGQENVAAIELEDLLKSLGDEDPEISITKVAGLLTARTNLDPFKVIEEVRRILADEPWRISSLLRFIPIERVVEAKPERIAEIVEKLSSKIPEDAKFRVTVEKRHTSLSSRELIEAAASKVDRKVDLENPDWIVLIEVLGGVAGVSVLKPSQILSVRKGKE
ncbi:MAG: RNA methyltransferase [Thaumarchaeota archaeon]|nr:MAG: RNA methyltransferase [Nitrososphaerota archaeon]